MHDETEQIRRDLTQRINAGERDRATLEQDHGQVWDTDELQRDYLVHSFLAPFVLVTRKADKVRGTLLFQARPRFYYGFTQE